MISFFYFFSNKYCFLIIIRLFIFYYIKLILFQPSKYLFMVSFRFHIIVKGLFFQVMSQSPINWPLFNMIYLSFWYNFLIFYGKFFNVLTCFTDKFSFWAIWLSSLISKMQPIISNSYSLKIVLNHLKTFLLNSS